MFNMRLLSFKLDFPPANPNKKLSYACRTCVRQAVVIYETSASTSDELGFKGNVIQQK